MRARSTSSAGPREPHVEERHQALAARRAPWRRRRAARAARAPRRARRRGVVEDGRLHSLTLGTPRRRRRSGRSGGRSHVSSLTRMPGFQHANNKRRATAGKYCGRCAFLEGTAAGDRALAARGRADRARDARRRARLGPAPSGRADGADPERSHGRLGERRSASRTTSSRVRSRCSRRGSRRSPATASPARLAFAVGLSCGGSIEVLIEPFAATPAWEAVRVAVEQGRAAALAVGVEPAAARRAHARGARRTDRWSARSTPEIDARLADEAKRALAAGSGRCVTLPWRGARGDGLRRGIPAATASVRRGRHADCRGARQAGAATRSSRGGRGSAQPVRNRRAAA